VKVYVVFEFPEINDVDSDEADYMVGVLESSLDSMWENDGFTGYVEKRVES